MVTLSSRNTKRVCRRQFYREARRKKRASWKRSRRKALNAISEGPRAGCEKVNSQSERGTEVLKDGGSEE